MAGNSSMEISKSQLHNTFSVQEVSAVHEGVQRALSSPLSTSNSYNGSVSPLVRANSAGIPEHNLQGINAAMDSGLYVHCLS